MFRIKGYALPAVIDLIHGSTGWFNFGLAEDDPLTWSGTFPDPDAHSQVPDIRLASYGVLPLESAASGNFADGQWTGTIHVSEPSKSVVLVATDAVGHTGASQPLFIVPWTDSDADGLPDDWEPAYALNPHEASDAATDSNDGGMTNGEEYLAGTNPREASDTLALTLARSPNGEMDLTFRAIAEKSYRVESKESLTQPDWRPASEEIVGDGLVIEFPIPAGSDLDATFYRIRLLP